MKLAPSVAYTGYALSGSGYGAAARAYIAALQSAGVPVRVTCVDGLPHARAHEPLERAYRQPEDPRAVPLWHLDPIQLAHLTGRYPRAVAISVWETDELPRRHVEALNRVGEVWVPSTFNEKAFRAQLSVPVFRIPHPLHPFAMPSRERVGFDLNLGLGLPPDAFAVLSVGTWQERKNLPGVIEAFVRAFPRDRNVHLVLKTSFPFFSPVQASAQAAEALHRAAPPDFDEAASRIHICARALPAACIAALFARADCYLGLHRGEGWCYPIFDAACMGIPVVATEGSGPLDYLDPHAHRLVHAESVRVGEDYLGPHFSFAPDAHWLEPDIRHAAVELRAVYENYGAAHARAIEAAAPLRGRYSLERIGALAAGRLAAFAAAQVPACLPCVQDVAAKQSPILAASLGG